MFSMPLFKDFDIFLELCKEFPFQRRKQTLRTYLAVFLSPRTMDNFFVSSTVPSTYLWQRLWLLKNSHYSYTNYWWEQIIASGHKTLENVESLLFLPCLLRKFWTEEAVSVRGPAMGQIARKLVNRNTCNHITVCKLLVVRIVFWSNNHLQIIIITYLLETI